MPDEATRRERLWRFFEFEFRHVALRSGSASSGRNAALYERLGFELKDEVRFEAARRCD